MSTTIRTIERRPQTPGNEKPPLLLLLHGFGSNEQDLMSLAPYLDPRLHILSARAIYDLGFGGYAWYPLYGVPGDLRADDAARDQALEILQKFIAMLPERVGADPRRFYLMGFSQGAIMSLGLALTMPELVAGVIASSGYLEPAFESLAEPAKLAGRDFLLLHGTDDEVIPVEGSRRANQFLSGTPARVAFHEYPTGHGIHPDALPVLQAWIAERLDNPPPEQIP